MTKQQNHSLSILFPCFNNKGTIASMVLEARKVAKEISNDFEIIVADDYSSDGSQELLLGLKNLVPELKTIFHHKKQGYGAALKSAFANAQKDLICYADGDAQYDIRELPRLLEKLDDNVDIVSGYNLWGNDPFYRVAVSTIYRFLMRLVFQLPIKDPDCDFRLMKREVINNLNLENDSGVLSIELLKKACNAGFVFAEAGVSHCFRMYGKSRALNVKRIFVIIGRLGKLWFKTI